MALYAPVWKRLVQSYGSTTWNVEFIFGKNRHTCKAKLDKSLHEQINAEVKVAVGLNKYATPHQIVEPILMEHFE